MDNRIRFNLSQAFPHEVLPRPLYSPITESTLGPDMQAAQSISEYESTTGACGNIEEP